VKSIIFSAILLVSSLASASTQVCGSVIIDPESATRIVTTDEKTGEQKTLFLESENPEAIALIRSVQALNDKFTRLVVCLEGEISADGGTLSTSGESVDFRLAPAVR
jgi:hypothetical protein